MPFPTAAVIAGGANLLGQGINAASTGKTNKKSRQHNKEMYEWQRRDNLADYHMQNAYNHPSAQMARLREAGLNPNLVYGDGATMATAQVKSADTKSWNPVAPQFDPGSAVGAYQDTRLRQAQVELLNKQTTATQTKSDLDVIKTLIGGTDLASKKLKLRFDTEMFKTQADILEAKLGNLSESTRKMITDQNYTVSQDHRAEQLKDATLENIASEIYRRGVQNTNDNRHTTAVVENLIKDGTLKALEIEMQKRGLSMKDDVISRMFFQVWKTPSEVKQNIQEFINKLKSSKNLKQ